VKPPNRRLPPSPKPEPESVSEPRAGAPVLPRRPRPIWSAMKTGLGVAVVVGASVAAGWGARRYVLGSPHFAVSSVQVRGQERRPEAAIVAESGILQGANAFGVDLDAARGALLADPWVEEASLSRRLPGTILIEVRERHAAALVVIGDTWLAAADGEPFKKLEAGDPVDLPLVTGLSPDVVGADREEARRIVRRGIDLANEYDRGALAKRAPLQEVHVDPSGAFTLVVGRPSMDLVIGGPPFRRKLEEAARVVAELDKRRAKAQAIMLDNETRPERVVARLR
jgi:cell division protein FtsQ